MESDKNKSIKESEKDFQNIIRRTDLEIFEEWHKETTAKFSIADNWQVAAIMDFAKYYYADKFKLSKTMPKLLCINNNYATGITINNQYQALLENRNIWFLIDDDGEIWGYEKMHFKIIE